jgi:ligand-binding sensor domain-containing protein
MSRRQVLAGLLASGASAAFAQEPSPSPSASPGSSGYAFSTSLTLFAGTASGLWRSTDWGGRWERIVSPATGTKIEQAGAIYAIFAIASLVFVAGDGGIYVSRDFGVNWERLKFSQAARCLMPTRWPHADPTLLVGTPAGLMVSPDGGYTFKPTALLGAEVHRMEWPGPELVVGTSRGVAVSRDTAVSFQAPGLDLPEAPVHALAVSSLFALDPVIFAGLQGHGLWRSGDSGRTWKQTTLEAESITDLLWVGPYLYVATTSGVFVSPDAGRSWGKAATGLEGRVPGRMMFPLAPDASTEGFLGTDDGVFHTTDGGQSWRPSGLQGERVITVATFPAMEKTPGRKRR